MRRHPTIAVFVLVPVLALLAGCGTSAGKDAADSGAKTSTTAKTADDETTDDSTDDGDRGDDQGGTVTSAQLADVLPTVDDVPTGYSVSDEDLTDTDESDESDDDSSSSSDDESDATDQAIYDACPGAEFLETLDDSGASPTEVSRNFETETQQTIEVALDPTVGEFTEDTADKIVDALADCDDISTTDEDGNAINMKISAEPSDYGDYGIEMSLDASFEFMGSELQIEMRGVVFSVDGTLVSVVVSSGLDEATFELVPGDYDTVPELASMLEEQVASL